MFLAYLKFVVQETSLLFFLHGVLRTQTFDSFSFKCNDLCDADRAGALSRLAWKLTANLHFGPVKGVHGHPWDRGSRMERRQQEHLDRMQLYFLRGAKSEI